jgi:hypothetical protein
MSATLFLNSINGYSGLAPVDYFYYALYGVINTTILPITIYIASSYVDYDYAKFEKEVTPVNNDLLKNYTPLNNSIMHKISTIKAISQVDYLKEKGLSINKDGSTNNLN